MNLLSQKKTNKECFQRSDETPNSNKKNNRKHLLVFISRKEIESCWYRNEFLFLFFAFSLPYYYPYSHLIYHGIDILISINIWMIERIVSLFFSLLFRFFGIILIERMVMVHNESFYSRSRLFFGTTGFFDNIFENG